MKVLINLENTEQFSEIDIEPDYTIEVMKYIIEGVFSVPFNEIALIDYNTNSRLNYTNNTIISNTNIKADSMIIVKQIKKTNVDDIMNMINTSSQPNTFNTTNNNFTSNSGFSNQNQKNSNNLNLGTIFDNTMKMLNNSKADPDIAIKLQAQQEATTIYNTCMADPGELSILFNTDVELAEVIASQSIKNVEDLIFNRIKRYKEHKDKEKREYEALLMGNQNDPEVQKKIESYIYKEKIQENKRHAMEYLPETFFSQHHMLYIPLEINKFKVIALVDTGAQMTIMSVDIAHKCGLYNLIDQDYKGQAIGVGTSKIIGVIHCAQIKIEDTYIMAKITVLENVSIGFILGLDNMRSHRCTIDLSINQIIFKDSGLKVCFLSDGEAKKLKEKNEEENLELIKSQSSNIEK